jgi:hypothetical protein
VGNNKNLNYCYIRGYVSRNASSGKIACWNIEALQTRCAKEYIFARIKIASLFRMPIHIFS